MRALANTTKYKAAEKLFVYYACMKSSYASELMTAELWCVSNIRLKLIITCWALVQLQIDLCTAKWKDVENV